LALSRERLDQPLNRICAQAFGPRCSWGKGRKPTPRFADPSAGGELLPFRRVGTQQRATFSHRFPSGCPYVSRTRHEQGREVQRSEPGGPIIYRSGMNAKIHRNQPPGSTRSDDPGLQPALDFPPLSGTLFSMKALLHTGLHGRACPAKLLERSGVPVTSEKRFLINNSSPNNPLVKFIRQHLDLDRAEGLRLAA
jgi:hypothetical protein